MTSSLRQRQILLGGLPKTGKTSFLALLYSAIANGQATGLALGHHRDDREYLNEIAERLMRCEEAVHTEVAEERELRLSLDLGDDKEEAVLRIPDLSGETWEHVATDREWSLEMEAEADRSEGFLIFVHSTKIDAHPSIAQVDAAAQALGAPARSTAPTRKKVDSKPALPPTQVHVVDALQLICEERSSRPSRAGIVVSAWDLVDGTPADWLARECPLVSQYAAANAGWLELRAWGVSAQGGKFGTKASRTRLAKLDTVDRAQVIHADGTPGNVADPVLWILRDGDSR
ncbi:MAG: hypothetical protein WKF96_10055 [Solirubrobacteraceae bacterium]